MRANFVTQPYADGFDLETFLRDGLARGAFDKLDVAVAWAKRSGLAPLEHDLRRFRADGGHIRVVVGISEGGATAQGLALAADIATEAYVFHVPGRTFHPKVYAFSGPDMALVFVGSHNLTRGGLTDNFEAATVVELDISCPEDRGFLADITAFVDRLVQDTDVCQRLDVVTLADLVSDPRYRVMDEDARRGRGGSSSDDSGEGEDDAGGLFGSSRHGLRRGRTSGASPSGRGATAAGGSGSLGVPAAAASSASGPVVQHRWFKQVRRADAQRLAGTSSPSCHMTLTQAGHPISHEDYFRDDFFAAAPWTSVGETRERATIRADVVIMGRSLGRIELQVDHNPDFGAEQGNRSTTLRWGPLNQTLRHEIDITDQWVTIEALSDGTFRIIAAAAPSGSFVR